MKAAVLLSLLMTSAAVAQEASSGFELRTTLSAEGIYARQLSEPPRNGNAAAAGMRAMFYPTWKLDGHWTVSGAVQVHTRPYFTEEFSTQGEGIRADLLQLHLGYARFWNDRSVVVRIGQLASAFGNFLLRYDDAVNPLIDMPLTYGYYYKGITNFGLPGAQVDVTLGKLDARAQFANSSPANRRSLFDSDQYGNWAGGIGYTIAPGFRAGASAYRGPYLHRQHPYYRPGEAKPSELPATGVGIDVQWSRGYWTAYGEWQWFSRAYRVMPDFTQQGSYAEIRRVLHPRWFVAGRVGYLRSSVGGTISSYDSCVGFRPNSQQIVKVGYQVRDSSLPGRPPATSVVVQFVTSVRLLSLARD